MGPVWRFCILRSRGSAVARPCIVTAESVYVCQNAKLHKLLRNAESLQKAHIHI